MPVLRFERFKIARQQRIRGQHQIIIGQCIKILTPLGSVQHQHGQIRRKFLSLAPPVMHQAGRRQHQSRMAQSSLLSLGQDMRQRLHGFPQPHIIGQNTGQIHLTQKLHPA